MQSLKNESQLYQGLQGLQYLTKDTIQEINLNIVSFLQQSSFDKTEADIIISSSVFNCK